MHTNHLSILKADKLQAMKDKDVYKRDVISSVIGEAQLLAKNALEEVNDNHVLRALRTELKQLNEAFDMMFNHMEPERSQMYRYKMEIVEGYLPKQLSEDVVKGHIERVFGELGLDKSMKSMGALMNKLAGELKGQVDNGMLSKMIKDFLTS